MVFKKGHVPVRKKSKTVKKSSKVNKNKSIDISDFYVKFGIKNDMKNNLSNLSYLVATLKKDLSIVNNFRKKKAFLRKELYETLISLRLGVDSLEQHMPSKEFEALKNKIAEISKYAKKEIVKKIKAKPVKKIVVSKPEPVKVIKEAFKKPEPVVEKKSSLYDNASDKEKKELELLRKDLEDISNQLKEN
jgi:hypothetical protein